MKKAFVLLWLACKVACFGYEVEPLSDRPKVVLIHNFLSDEECDYMIKIARPELKRSMVVDEAHSNSEVIDSRRTSHGVFLTRSSRDRVVRNIETRLSELTGIPKKNGESLHVLYYGEGGEYQPHYDFFDPATLGGASHLNRGGQRLATVIMYLNDPLKGGETIFPKVGLAVLPQKGMALLFYSCLPTGQEDFLTLHGGSPVIEGEKWIATKWFRKNTFQ